jgi:hypothetical protein
MIRWLLSRLRVCTHCRRGDHRETCEGAFGVLRLRCLDCERATPLGWIYVGCSNHRRSLTRAPWELDDA